MSEEIRKAFDEWREKTIRDSYHGGMSAGTSHPLANFRGVEGARLAFDHQQKRIDELEGQIAELRGIFGIGENASGFALKTNVENCKRLADQLHAIEHAFFMVPGEPDEDYPDDEPEDECLVNSWGSTTEQYVEQFRAALEALKENKECT